jgi:disulfide oxidoreductase YuzD
LIDVGLVKLSRGEYASAIMMPTKKDIFGNWMEHYMCRDYHVINKQMHLDRYVMPLAEEIFDALG